MLEKMYGHIMCRNFGDNFLMKYCRELSVNEIIWVIVRLVILLILSIGAFWPEVFSVCSGAAKSSERVHMLIVPVLIFFLIYLRRAALVANLTKGSMWGILFLILGFGIYACFTWPFDYGYLRVIAIVPVLAGVIMISCGGRVLKLSLPMLLLVLISIPVPSRIYAKLIIRPETYTITAAAATLDKLPGVDVFVKGVDLIFDSNHDTGIIALGESNRGARLLFVFAAIGIFVVFSRIRPIWRILVIAIASVPVVLLCNLFRFICWGLVVMYIPFDVASGAPRVISTICSVLVLYGLVVLMCVFKVNLFIEEVEIADTGKVFHE